jgi:BlaI family transcriptional regulator, penicillinase repressor
MTNPTPTDRELAILDVLWKQGEATVREVYEELRKELPIVQNTVQAFLRTMTEKGLVSYRTEGRSFVYQAALSPEEGRGSMLNRVLQRAYDGALDRLVAGAISLKRPSSDELARLRELLDEAEREQGGQES